LDTKAKYSFDNNATYLLAGGFGGLARRTARWMASRGAKNLILLSRSGPHSVAAKLLLEDLQAQGIRVEAPACDITSKDSLSAVLAQCTRTLPTIKGCIQGAMVLKVDIPNLFECTQAKNTNPVLGRVVREYELR
jgi:NAD(P)-dependent dehydrogenase (short-subunit alcohol dehydrogenase family)